jgi:hypothetical protein
VIENKEIKPEERNLLAWVEALKPFFSEMQNIMTTVEKLSVLLKHNGLNKITCTACLKILKSGRTSEKQKVFKTLFIDCLNNNLNKRPTKKETLLCTDDIIETIFGRYKHELKQNPMNRITDMALIIPAMTSSLNEEEIMKAIDGNTAKQIKQWRKDNLCDSLSVKRNEFYNTAMAG